VERCHGLAHQGSYSNAMHQWGVAMLLHAIWPEDFPRLALACLTHDVPEAWVGDIPAPTCRYANIKPKLDPIEGRINRSLGLPVESELQPEDYAKLKACDRLEFWLWCCEEQLKGNMFAHEGRVEVERFFTETPGLLPGPAFDLFQHMSEEIRLRGLTALVPKQAGVVKDAVGPTAQETHGMRVEERRKVNGHTKADH
jgi:hypothetical protein